MGKKNNENHIYENEKEAKAELNELSIKSVRSRDPFSWNGF